MSWNLNDYLMIDGIAIDADEPCVYWNPHDSEVFLDGMFTPDQLRAIANHMDKHRATQEP